MSEVERLSVREVRVLAALEGGPRGLVGLARELGIPPSSLYGILTKLQANGLVARDEEKRYVITERGRQALAELRRLLAVSNARS